MFPFWWFAGSYVFGETDKKIQTTKAWFEVYNSLPPSKDKPGLVFLLAFAREKKTRQVKSMNSDFQFRLWSGLGSLDPLWESIDIMSPKRQKVIIYPPWN